MQLQGPLFDINGLTEQEIIAVLVSLDNHMKDIGDDHPNYDNYKSVASKVFKVMLDYANSDNIPGNPPALS